MRSQFKTDEDYFTWSESFSSLVQRLKHNFFSHLTLPWTISSLKYWPLAPLLYIRSPFGCMVRNLRCKISCPGWISIDSVDFKSRDIYVLPFIAIGAPGIFFTTKNTRNITAFMVTGFMGQIIY